MVLVLNDHVWKAAWPSTLTGKLSDLAGLAFFPLLLQAGVELARSALRRPVAPSRSVLVGAALATALVFTLVKSTALGGAAYVWGLALLQWPIHALLAALRSGHLPPLRPVTLVQDPTDLLCLPAILVGVRAGWRRCVSPRSSRT